MQYEPDFYLTSSEASPTLVPRLCWIVDKLWSDEREENFLRIRIDPPIIGKHIGIDQEFINEVVIATRHKDTNLDPVSELPLTVYVCYISNSQIINIGHVSSRDLRIILIGEIYKTRAQAEKAIRHEVRRY